MSKLEPKSINQQITNKYQEIWESRASIRTRPRKIIDFSKEGYFFPEDRQPLLLYPDIINLGEEIKKNILLQSFYKYLHDITALEVSLLSSCNKIIQDELLIKYSEEVKLNAYTIIIDEYYHVYIAKDMITQLNNHFPDLVKFKYTTPDSCGAVLKIKNQLAEKYHDIFEIIAVCLFETTLIRELVEFFHNETIHPSVRYYINDHMNDESKHHGFFFDILSHTWENLSEDYKENIGKYIAIFIKDYLSVKSEKSFNLELLINILQDKKKAEEIILELYEEFDVTPHIPIVKNVINILKNSNLLQDKYIKASFQNIGWNV